MTGGAQTESNTRLRRVLHTALASVWRAWTDPDEVAVWWGRRGWAVLPGSVMMDVQPGGVFRLLSRHEDGRSMSTDATFREVVPFERLVFAEEPAAGCPEHNGAVITVTFAYLGEGRTELVVDVSLRMAPQVAEQAIGGFESALDRLAEHLA
jgi:uncharacterized protein YndB with AHSA1/START domain